MTESYRDIVRDNTKAINNLCSRVGKLEGKIVAWGSFFGVLGGTLVSLAVYIFKATG